MVSKIFLLQCLFAFACCLGKSSAGTQCLELESNISPGFDLTTLDGDYTLSLLEPSGVIDVAWDKLVNCNRAVVRSRNNGVNGVNVVIKFFYPDSSNAVFFDLSPHFNTSEDITSKQTDYYSTEDFTWRKQTYKFLFSTPDAFGVQVCSIDEDNAQNVRFYVFVVTRMTSDLSSDDVRKLLPQSLADRKEIRVACAKN